MSAVADKRGLKRVCADCGIRFYDLNKRPIICPSCATEFTGEAKVKTRRGRVPDPIAEKAAVEEKENKKAAPVNDDDEDEEDDGVEVVSLDDLEEGTGDDDEDGDVSIDLDDDLDLDGDVSIDLDDDFEDDDEDLDVEIDKD